MYTNEQIINELTLYIKKNSIVANDYLAIPQDRSLLELGILDSFGIIELVTFIEDKWSINIDDSELTTERFGGIEKMAKVIFKKLQKQ